MVKVDSPIYVYLPSKGLLKKQSLNFNTVRNAQGFAYNRIKEKYKEIMLPKVKSFPSFSQCEIEYILYLGSKRKSDLMNWVSIIDKFFQDVLVEAGKLPDDNTDYVPKIKCRFGGIDKDNPRMEITVKSIA